jgi:hypothetical protein
MMLFYVQEKTMEHVLEDFTHQQHAEGRIARNIEQQTTKLPSDIFLWAGLGSIGASLVLQLMGKKHLSQFVGHWVPTFLIFGLYNKVVKVAGSDRYSRLLT